MRRSRIRSSLQEGRFERSQYIRVVLPVQEVHQEYRFTYNVAAACGGGGGCSE